MAKKRIYELLNKAVLTVSDLFMIDKSGDVNATNVSGQQIVDLVDANIVRVETVSGTAVDNTDPLNPVIDTPSLAFTDLTDVPTDYTGEGGKYVMVSLTEDGLVFNTVSTSDTNIYNIDGTLTGNRTVTHNGNTLQFNGLTRVKAFNATSTSIGFSFRNFGDTADLTRFYNTGNIQVVSGVVSVGDDINTAVRLQGVTNVNGMVAVKGYHYGIGGTSGVFIADGAGATAIQAQAVGSLASAIRAFGGIYALDFRGGFLDSAYNNNLPQMPQCTVATEAALLVTLIKGRWYYLDNGDGTATAKMKL